MKQLDIIGMCAFVNIELKESLKMNVFESFFISIE